MIQGMLYLYEYEGCPFCGRVREALMERVLDAVVFPCPRGGRRFRPQAEAVGGRQQFPLLVDDDTDTVLYESGDIIRYFDRRDARRAPPEAAGALGTAAGARVRDLYGMRVADDRGRLPPAWLFELFSDERDRHARAVRGLLAALELPYVLRSPEALADAPAPAAWIRRAAPDCVDGAHPPVPSMIDPNTEHALFKPAAIAKHLKTHYA
ncbi:glutathione S-transferase N-terminal domain-containing protein [Salinisphaera sp. RV14]|uniref:glutathione S-transferase N-terminal domain-containing protein n=2 Tax=unclassified Salinisphaera TaxID=2649847 RepID=UPI003F86F031